MVRFYIISLPGFLLHLSALPPYQSSHQHHSLIASSLPTLPMCFPSPSSSLSSLCITINGNNDRNQHINVRATLLFSSQRAAEHLLALTNPCWSLPIGCSLVHRGRIESTITLHPAKGEDMAMSATTMILASLIEGVPKRRNRSLKGRGKA